MRHFFTKGTVEASIWCIKCHRYTMWAICGGRPQYAWSVGQTVAGNGSRFSRSRHPRSIRVGNLCRLQYRPRDG